MTTSARSPQGGEIAVPDAPDGARRGRPRSERAQTAILTAAGELLLSAGLDAVSMDAVAERAGVSKATIYRWWPSKETLALDALHREWSADAAVPDTGAVRSDLLALLRPWVRQIRNRPYARVIGALLTEARSNPAFADEYLARLVTPRRARAATVLARAVDRGELPAAIDIDLVLDLIYGPLYHRLLHGHAPLTDRFVEGVVAGVLDGLRPRGQEPPRSTAGQ